MPKCGCATAIVRFGCLLNREGWNVGKKLVYRLYQEEGLTLRTSAAGGDELQRRRRERFRAQPRTKFGGLDFIADQLADGRRFRALTVVDIYTRESLAIESGQSMKGEDVVRVLNRIRLQRGSPKMLVL